MSYASKYRSMYDARLAIHMTLTGVTAWMAVVLVLPGDTFSVNPNWHYLAHVATKDQWAMMFWFTASLGLGGIITRSPLLRLLSALTLATTFSTVAVLFLIGSPLDAASGVLIGLAAQGYYLAWRRVDAAV